MYRKTNDFLILCTSKCGKDEYVVSKVLNVDATDITFWGNTLAGYTYKEDTEMGFKMSSYFTARIYGMDIIIRRVEY